ncbi:MAG: IS110 family transposase [Acidimicrobiales bacterium]
MTIVADVVDFSIGIDSHRDTHTAALIDAANTAVIDDLTIAVDTGGYQQLFDWVAAHTGTGTPRVWAVEGCGSYAAGLTRFLLGLGEWVVEVERPARPSRQTPAKDDLIDAVRAARETLGRDLTQAATPRQGDTRDALAVLLAARHGAVQAAKAAANQLHAAITAAPEPLRARFDTLKSTKAKLDLAESLRPSNYNNVAAAATAQALKSIARRHRVEQSEAVMLKERLTELIQSWRPDLLNVQGVGPVVAATVLCAWSHPGRCRSDAAFASLAGTAPIPASSGQTTGRMRLNHGGDRRLNTAIHTIALTRLRHDPDTRSYRERRIAQGKTEREIRRCLKRYITRQLHRQLKTPLDNT